MKMIEGGTVTNWGNQKLVKKINDLFMNSLCDQQYGGMYYVAEIASKVRWGNPTPKSENIEFELYCQAASLGHVLSLFKIALMYSCNDQDTSSASSTACTKCTC
jgi:hypothetical protein